jgi:hypothetical protein
VERVDAPAVHQADTLATARIILMIDGMTQLWDQVLVFLGSMMRIRQSIEKLISPM